MQSYRSTAIIFTLALTGSINYHLLLPAPGAIAGLKFSFVEALSEMRYMNVQKMIA